MTPHSDAEDAYLRLAFNEAAENQRGWVLPLDAVDRHGNFLHPWHTLYARVRDTEGGRELLTEIQLLRDRIDALEAENARLRLPMTPMPERIILTDETGLIVNERMTE